MFDKEIYIEDGLMCKHSDKVYIHIVYIVTFKLLLGPTKGSDGNEGMHHIFFYN